MLSAFRWLGRFEGTSFILLLLVAMPLKYFAGIPEPVRIVGMAHGLLFIAYLLLANYLAIQLKWSSKVWGLAYVSAVVPLGTFWFESRYILNSKRTVP